MGIVYQNKGDYERALEFYQKALEIAKKVGDIMGVAATVGMIGKVLHMKKNYRDAFIDYLISLDIFERIGSPNLNIINELISELTKEMGEEDFNRLLEEFKNRP